MTHLDVPDDGAMSVEGAWLEFATEPGTVTVIPASNVRCVRYTAAPALPAAEEPAASTAEAEPKRRRRR